MLSMLRNALSVLLIACCATAMAADAKRPNFVLVMADDQGWGDVGYNSDSPLQTPVMDEMAATALRFDRFYAAAPVCSPTRGSVMTGRHPNRFACFSWGHPLRPQEVTVAEALKQAGYTTGHFGKWHLGSTRQASPVSPGNSGFDRWVSSPNFYDNSPLLVDQGRVIETQGESSMVTVEKALEFITSAAKNEQPFLAVVWFGNPHTPHEAWPELKKLYADQPDKLAAYWAEITGMDRALGRLRDELRSLGVAENTVLWYTSDNGANQPGSVAGLSGRKGNLLEGGIRVPAIIEWPARIRSHRAVSAPCGTVDIYPTVLELAGVKVEGQPPLDGTSLVPILEGKPLQREQPLGFWVYPAPGRGMPSGKMLREQRNEPADAPLPPQEAPAAFESFQQYSTNDPPGHAALIDGDYKLHRIPQNAGQGRNANAPAERFIYKLYNLADDPQEKHDLADQQPERLAAMKAALEAWQQSVIRSLNGEDYQ